MYRFNFEAFTTPCELHIDTSSLSFAQTLTKAVFENTKRLERLYSFFCSDSEIYALNTRISATHLLSDELAALIRLSLFYTDVTLGTFDIATAGTLKELSTLSTLAEYYDHKERLIPFASSAHLILEGNTLTFAYPDTKIDLGGLVKEYAVDQSIFILQQAGIDSALVNFGGDIAAIGVCEEFPWRIGIQDPHHEEKNLLEVDLDNVSLCTSGHSKRFTSIGSEQISHIVMASGHEKCFSQVSIMAPTTVDAGVWSTALLIEPTLQLPEHIKVISTYTHV